MTTFRLLIIALALMLTGAATVVLRAEQAQLACRTATLQKQAVQLRRKVWHQQLEIARLRAPAQVRQRGEGLNLMARGPGEAGP